MTGNSRRSLALAALVGVSLLLLPVLAVLQYRLIGQVSDAERERSERVLRRATHEVAEDLDVELVRAAAGLAVDGNAVEQNDWSDYSARYTGWQAAAVAPDIVGQVLLVDRDESGLRLRRWEPDTRTFVTATWVEELSTLRQEMQRRLDAWRDQPPDEPVKSDDLLTPSGDAIVVPVGPLPIPSAAEHLPITVFKPVFGYTILRLDLDYIKTQFLPHLVDQYFRGETASEYRLAVVDRQDPTRVIYQLNVDGLEDLLARHDTEEALFGVRPDVYRRAVESLRGPGSLTGDRRRSLFFSLSLRRPPSEDGRRGGGHPFDDLTRWRLVARHRAGSLEAAVTVARTRNLLLSFGVLLLMAGSVAMLATTTRRAQRLAKQQMEFVAAVSHELRTPVSVVSAAADNLAAGFVTDPARIKQYGTRLQTESRRLGDTVERVLLYAGIEAGRGAALRTPTSVGGLIDDALAASAGAIAEGAVTVEKDVPGGLPPVLADAAALRSCLQNLIANAVKYGGRDRWVKVSAGAEIRRGRREVRLSVADHGLGIPAAELPHIFEPFYRGHEAQSRQIQGNGLGLSIVKGIVEAHGGRVSVDSHPGRGSVFVVILPAAEGAAATVDSAVGQVTTAPRAT